MTTANAMNIEGAECGEENKRQLKGDIGYLLDDECAAADRGRAVSPVAQHASQTHHGDPTTGSSATDKHVLPTS